MNEALTGLKLYGPLILALFLLVSAFLLKKPTKRSHVSFDFFGFFQYKLPISSLARSRIVTISLATICLSMYLFLDYSEFFPRNLKMEVYFDQSAIQSGVNQFSDQELSDLGIRKDFEAFQHIYYEELDTALAKMLKVEKFFTQQRALIHSEGSTVFVVEKMPGIQNYHITESNGNLTHVLERPGVPDITFKSFFEKAISNYDNLRPTLFDIYVKHAVVLRPMFKQIIAENYRSDRIIFDHTLFGVTKVQLFPYPSIGKTVYLFQMEGHGLIPIAVAEYR